MQTLSLEGFMELIGHEAIVLEPYFDGGGVLTWGVGHTAAAGAPLPSSMWGRASTVSDVLAILRADLLHYEAKVRAAFTRPLSQTEFEEELRRSIDAHKLHAAENYATQNGLVTAIEPILRAIERLGDRLDRVLDPSRTRG